MSFGGILPLLGYSNFFLVYFEMWILFPPYENPVFFQFSVLGKSLLFFDMNNIFDDLFPSDALCGEMAVKRCGLESALNVQTCIEQDRRLATENTVKLPHLFFFSL